MYSVFFCRYSSFRETKSAKLSLIFDTILSQKTLDFSWFDNVETTQHSWQKQTKSRKNLFDLLDIETTVQKKKSWQFCPPTTNRQWLINSNFSTTICVANFCVHLDSPLNCYSVMRVNSWKHHRQTRNCQNWKKLVNTPQCKNEIWFWISVDKFILWRLKFRGWQPWSNRTNVPRTKL